MKSPKVKGIGEVVTEYGAKVMKIFKKGLLQRSLFDFYGDVKANAIRVKESSSVPQTPVDNDGGVVYVKNSDGKLYYKSNEVSEVEISANGGHTDEDIEDIAGSLVATGGTKTGITITYDDANGDMDFVVDHDAATNFVAAEHYRWDNDISSTATINAANIPTLNQNTTGSAATLTTPRAINGVNFDGSAPITITAAGSTLSDTVPVSKGGTGATSFADKAVIITQDSGTDTLAAVTMSTNGQLLIGGTDGPAVATLTQGNGITITNANGGITLAVDSDIDTSGESGTVDNIGNLTGDVTSSNRATTIANDAVTYAKMQDVSATNVVLGRDSAGAGIVEEISASSLRTILNVEDGATADQTKADIDALGIAASTVTNGVYTSGNQTIAGTKTFSSTLTYSGANNHSLSLNNTSATGSPFISFNQNGSRKSFIQHNDTGDTIKIASEFGRISLQTGVSGAETAYLDIENDGVIRFGAVDADSVLTTDGNMTFRIDADNDETSQKFIFQNNASTEIASLNESGVLDLEGIVRPDITYIKILPRDFIADDVGRPAQIDDTGSDRWLKSHSTAKLYASVDIPIGFKATHVDLYGSGTSAITVYEADVDSKTVTSKGTGNIGTQINITDVTADATNYLLIELDQTSSEEVYGGKVTIAKE